jgi:hypothetical protein
VRQALTWIAGFAGACQRPAAAYAERQKNVATHAAEIMYKAFFGWVAEERMEGEKKRSDNISLAYHIIFRREKEYAAAGAPHKPKPDYWSH